ncbi:MAG: class I SAM-dependent methyltransferase [Deltaproteobacteria bacterium]|nr:class I SAM-dependent methyltransferase [Deltaproteobacteria bacterium]
MRRRLAGADRQLVSAHDTKYLTILQEKFMHDRRSLIPLIERLKRRGEMVEVGSLAGFSTKLFASYFERVTSIDPYAAGYDDGHDKNSDNVRLALARDLFTVRFIDEPRVVQHREPSAAGCRRFEDRSLDFVYLDGSHTYEAVRDDIRYWQSKVRSGGAIAGDDYTWEGVERAVREAYPEHELVEGRWLVLVP